MSISEPGPWTPSRYDPKVKILPPAAVAADSERPRAIETLYTNFLTRAATRPRTISLFEVTQHKFVSNLRIHRE